MEKQNDERVYKLKKQNEQLELILNAHIKVEEIMKNMPEPEEFPEKLVETLVDREGFSAILFERLVDSKEQLVSQTAGFLAENGRKKIMTDHSTGFNRCVKDYMDGKLYLH